MPDLPEQLNQLRERVEQETVECPCVTLGFGEDYMCDKCADHYAAKPDEPYHSEECLKCNGSGRIPNPAYAGLLEVLSQRCDNRRFADPSLTSLLKDYPDHFNSCPACHGTNRVTRSWEGCRPGALAGALFRATVDLNWFSPRLMGWYLYSKSDPDLAAVTAVMEALDGTRGGL